MLAHDVYFTLKDRSDAAKAALLAACKTHLSDHPGTVSFSCGTRADRYSREVNDRDFDVSLHLVFATEADHDAYQDHERHHQFIAENRENWARARVFDSHVEGA